jgi:DNA-binding GntR family transcriptional regulator
MPQRTQLWEHVVDALRKAIVTGDLPPGTRLVETELADKLGSSRWPVRQAIARLEQECLVVTYPNRGAFVVGLTIDDVHEIYALRRLLEGHAARRASKRMKPEHVAQLKDVVRQMVEAAARGDLSDFSALDMEFHHQLFVIGDSRRLLEMWKLLSAPASALLVVSARTYPDLADGTGHRHQALIEALMTGDTDTVEAAVREHLTQAEARAVERLVEGRETPVFLSGRSANNGA